MASSNMLISLYAARVNRDLTRKEVSQKTGIPYNRLGHYERGQAEPRATELQKLCILYDIGIDQLRFDPPSSGEKKASKKKK